MHYHPGLLLHWGLQHLKPTGQYPESILGKPFPKADPVFEDPLIYVYASSGGGFQELCSQWEGIITEDEVVDFGIRDSAEGRQWYCLLSFVLIHYT